MLTQLVAMAKIRELERELEARRRAHELRIAASGTPRGVLRLRSAVSSLASRLNGRPAPTATDCSVPRLGRSVASTGSQIAPCCATC